MQLQTYGGRFIEYKHLLARLSLPKDAATYIQQQGGSRGDTGHSRYPAVPVLPLEIGLHGEMMLFTSIFAGYKTLWPLKPPPPPRQWKLMQIACFSAGDVVPIPMGIDALPGIWNTHGFSNMIGKLMIKGSTLCWTVGFLPLGALIMQNNFCSFYPYLLISKQTSLQTAKHTEDLNIFWPGSKMH